MASAKDIYEDGIDQCIHADDMGVDCFLEMFQLFLMELDRSEPFLEIFGADLGMMLWSNLVALEEVKELFGIFLEEHPDHDNHDDDDKN